MILQSYQISLFKAVELISFQGAITHLVFKNAKNDNFKKKF